LRADVADWIAAALHESQDDNECFHRTAVMQLQQRYAAVQAKLDKAYDDRLAGHITDDLWRRKSGEWEAELSSVGRETALQAGQPRLHHHRLENSRTRDKRPQFVHRQNWREQARSLKTLV
jgi:hypothetical protein